MYSFDIGILSAEKIINSQDYDPWLVRRLIQIDNGVPASQLITRWEFDTENVSTFTYLGYLAARVTSYFLFIIPAMHIILAHTTDVTFRFYDYVIDRFQYVYALATRTVPVYESKKNLTQLFLTLLVADERVKKHQRVESSLLEPGQLWTKQSKEQYLNHFKKAIVTPQLNRDLVERAVQKALNTLTAEEFKTLLTAFTYVFCNRADSQLKKQIVLKALSCCEGTLQLPEGMHFDGDEIAVFGQTRCAVDINGAHFANIPLQARDKIFAFNANSELKAHFIT